MRVGLVAVSTLVVTALGCGATELEVTDPSALGALSEQDLRRSCGDGVCQKRESCSTCAADCGQCPVCTPTTCTAQGKNCGSISDGCGGTLNCGSCTSPETCGGGGTANVCGAVTCTPTTCAAQGKNCGSISDGCGGTLNCGSCTSPQTCGGGGTANVCGSTSSGSQFQLVLEDNFDGSDLNSTVWSKYGDGSDWPGHGGNGLRVARAISVANGIATITATPAANTSTGELESGAFTARSGYRYTYGRYEVRIRVDDDPSRVTSGLALLWNTDESAHPWCQGESDFYETGTGRNGWSTFLHYEIGTPNCSDATTQAYCSHPSDPRQWHTVVLEWTPSRYEVYVDGVSDCRFTNPDYIPDWSQRLTFQLDAMNSGTLAAPVRLQIDYVRIYQYVP